MINFLSSENNIVAVIRNSLKFWKNQHKPDTQSTNITKADGLIVSFSKVPVFILSILIYCMKTHPAVPDMAQKEV